MKSYLFPGQGSQHAGMGEKLFDAFPDITAMTDAILGYSIKELCLNDPDGKLGQTRYTQPALFVVNALAFRQRVEDTGDLPDFVAGHSLGEYNALECTGAIGFEDGLRLVRKRAELMSTAVNGAMAAIIGIAAEKVGTVLAENSLEAIDVANYNAPTQTVISGLRDDVARAQQPFERVGAMFIPLNVSGAFHSRYMLPASAEYDRFLQGFVFSVPRIPIIANVTGRPYEPSLLTRTLVDQLTHPVRWTDSMHFLLQEGVTDFIEVGPREILTKLMRGIRDGFKNRPVPLARDHAQTSPAQTVADWNKRYPSGTKVRARGYSEPLTTKSEAVVLFGHRAAIYMQGYNGYFALDEVEPL